MSGTLVHGQTYRRNARSDKNSMMICPWSDSANRAEPGCILDRYRRSVYFLNEPFMSFFERSQSAE